MSRSDLDAVAARRAALGAERAKLDQTRTELFQEDQELEVTERVLMAIEDIRRRMDAETPAARPPAAK